MANPSDDDAPLRANHAVRLLLIIPFVMTMWVPFFNRIDPMLAGIPFFYWYQILCIVISAVITFIVYRAES
ncbi:MAG: DUF3311 domain-containing protein [Rhodospirillales bacterium]|nr:DUF3311 domain-containing protein [Rhodospirillales bacterium]